MPLNQENPSNLNATKTGDDNNMLVNGLIALAALDGAAVGCGVGVGNV